MAIIDGIKEIITAYGGKIQLSYDGATVETNGFIQPLRYKNKMYLDGSYLPCGYCDGGHYLYIGKAEAVPDNTDVILKTADDREYIIVRSEMYYLWDTPLYLWAILTPSVRGDENTEL
ncbi:MAG TPA: hypothetical protein GX401_01550 [Clostridiales bacterium]|nr:hypothetical protein [Clostridiales bacterium]